MPEQSTIEIKGREMIVTRLINAPRELVWEAWTDPKHLKHWWGPDGFTDTTISFDFRVGGEWKHTMHGPDGRDYPNRSVYKEITKPEKISYLHGGDDDKVLFEASVTFAEEDGRTRVTMHSVFESEADVEFVIKNYHADEGGKQNLARMAEYVEDTFIITRMFNAPQKLVWEAWTKPEHLIKWFAPKDVSMLQCDMDFRVGGTFHYQQSTMAGFTLWGLWRFLEIDPTCELTLIQSFANENREVVPSPFDPPGELNWPLEMFSRTEFIDYGDRTEVKVRWSPYKAAPHQRAVFTQGFESMKNGWGGTLDHLEEYLASQT